MKNPKRLIGKKVKGFKFESNKNVGYSNFMDKYIDKVGIIKRFICGSNYLVEFDSDSYFYYPADQIEAHLVNEETFTFNANHNKIKLKDEIPTLSDGVMMLVSFNNIRWHKRKVIGQKYGLFYGWNGNTITQYKSVKPLEPTKEQQLTAILGNSEKVSEIMELFKK